VCLSAEILCASDVFGTLGGWVLWRKRGLTQRETAKTKTAKTKTAKTKTAKTKTAQITINLIGLLIRITAET
jgi:hypothetical protein